MASSRERKDERRRQTQERRRQQSHRVRRRNLVRRLVVISGGAVIAALVIGGLVLVVGTQKELPPTGFGPGHSESLPRRQINAEPTPRPVQEHVMEHVGTGSPPGVLVQYNCENYTCAPNLIQQLEDVVRSYPPLVFLAPYPGMDAKIALAAPSRMELLEAFDEARIRQFIDRSL